MFGTLRAPMTLDAYLDTSFEPEHELLGGEARPKPMGTFTHSKMASKIARILERHFGFDRVAPELSVRGGEDVLIPDVCVLRNEDPRLYRDILHEAPLLCIEIVSPSQRPAELLAKCQIYHDWGVEYCWVIDPVAKRAWNCHASDAVAREAISALDGPATVPLQELFA